MKKLLSFFLSLLLILSIIPVANVSANSFNYYQFTIANGEATLTGISPFLKGEVIIPSTIGFYPVTAIGDSVLANRTGITAVVIPHTVKHIGEKAFYMCENLESVSLPKRLESMGDLAFYGCDKLSKVWFPGNPDDIDPSLFDGFDDKIKNANWNSYTPGILSENGSSVTTADSLLVLHAAVGKVDLTYEQKVAGDIDNIAGISSYDALLILHYSVKKISVFPIDE